MALSVNSKQLHDIVCNTSYGLWYSSLLSTSIVFAACSFTFRAKETWIRTRGRCAAGCTGERQRARVRVHRPPKVAGAEERVAAVLQEGRVAVRQAGAVRILGLILGTHGRHDLHWVRRQVSEHCSAACAVCIAKEYHYK